MKRTLMASALWVSLACAIPAQANIVGHFDYVYSAITDQAVGWICDNNSTTETPNEVSLVVYLDDTYYDEYGLGGSNWPHRRDDIAYNCENDPFVGFSLTGFFAGYPSRKVSIYIKDLSSGSLIGEMSGSPKYCSNSPGGYCY